MQDQLFPKQLSEVTFSNSEECLLKLFQPVISFRTERFSFPRLVQQPGQSVDEYIKSLKSLANRCRFETLNGEAIIDQIIFGVLDITLRKRLLSIDHLTLEKKNQVSLAA